MTGNQMMLLIKSLDPHASIGFSEYTGKWYVAAGIEIGDGCILSGITEHRDTPDMALDAYFARLIAVRGIDDYIAARPLGERRNYKWNGATFVEVSIEHHEKDRARA